MSLRLSLLEHALFSWIFQYSPQTRLLAMALSVSDAVFFSVAIELLLYGVYTCLFFGSSYLLIFKKKKTKVIFAMIALNITMWSVATTHAAVSLHEKFWGFLRKNGAENTAVFEDYTAPRIYSQLALDCVNFVLGDGVVIWRAWILWNRNRWILFVSLILLFSTLGTGATVTYALGSCLKTVGSLSGCPALAACGTAAMILIVTTNLWTTSLIAYRTWTHYRLIRTLTGESLVARFCKQNGILTFLIESGICYCCSWVFVSTDNGIFIMLGVLAQLTAIYPTLIITLVCLRSTLDVAIETFEQTYRSQKPEAMPMQASPVLRIGVQRATYISGEEVEHLTSCLPCDKAQSV
ncbi:uncharacterized protein EV420DRAFT_86533 [Desarmillaria tabescens]|uniref:Uncharacterized protein n=1 Tax=Armillaria tabescens TaxID=1929756 RepID=A0AA39NQL3_ARMTA|nr:uncharacterized protein EV420DRAFT_86533 [Desarmillaria tabescens]KAK0470049.1 hypothetical protein EV420DRAFT_86533 [Desarmillaria tabescens]